MHLFSTNKHPSRNTQLSRPAAAKPVCVTGPSFWWWGQQNLRLVEEPAPPCSWCLSAGPAVSPLLWWQWPSRNLAPPPPPPPGTRCSTATCLENQDGSKHWPARSECHGIRCQPPLSHYWGRETLLGPALVSTVLLAARYKWPLYKKLSVTISKGQLSSSRGPCGSGSPLAEVTTTSQC